MKTMENLTGFKGLLIHSIIIMVICFLIIAVSLLSIDVISNGANI